MLFPLFGGPRPTASTKPQTVVGSVCKTLDDDLGGYDPGIKGPKLGSQRLGMYYWNQVGPLKVTAGARAAARLLLVQGPSHGEG